MNNPKRQNKFLHIREVVFIGSVITLYWIYCLQSNNRILATGISHYGWLGKVVFFMICCHLSMITISIYLHRSQTHLAIEYHPLVRHFFRFWLWLTTGIVRCEWVAIHRAHHQSPDARDDPHSPLFLGIKNMFSKGLEIYNEAKKPQIIKKFGYVNDNDFLEKHLYRHHEAGPICLLFLDLLLFGLWGIVIWSLQIIFAIVTQASIINGLGHYRGYRNFNTNDNSRNIVPWAIIIGGEELHNNHHADPAAAKFSYLKKEIDIGWLYIKLLKKLKLAHLRKNQESLSLKETKEEEHLQDKKTILEIDADPVREK